MRSRKKFVSIHKEKNIDFGFYNHTSYYDATVSATLNEIKQMFGCPQNKNRIKTQNGWYLILISDDEGYRAITLYDYNHERKIKPNEVIEWHIGGNGKRETFLAKETIEDYLQDLRDGKIYNIKIKTRKNKNGEILSCTQCPLQKKNDNAEKIMAGTQYCFLKCDSFENINEKEKKIICRKI